jgi:hypothetical protein
MAESGEKQNKEKLHGGLYKKTEKAIDVSRATIQDLQNLNKVSQRSGIDFPYDGDKNTITPERFVVVSREKKEDKS